MISKVLSVFAVVVAVVVAVVNAAPQHLEAARYPAGVDPSACPGFPICDNALLHSPNKHQNQWNAPQHNQWNPPQHNQWNAPQQHNQWNAPQQHNQWNAPAPAWNAAPVNNHLTAGGDKYPAGVSPQSCPNYPFCDNAGGHAAQKVAPLPGWTERLYPAGVSAHECPNFPYCH